MGGHGALTLYLSSLSKTKQYRSASAFSPICHPLKVASVQKAFKSYLTGGLEEAQESGYDATELIGKTKDPVHILIDYVRAISENQNGRGRTRN
jgi:S-formylglutathione hydrolase